WRVILAETAAQLSGWGKVGYSVQQLIDCFGGSQGCITGKSPSDALLWWKKNTPSNWNSYPYSGPHGTCKHPKAAHQRPKVNTTGELPSGEEYILAGLHKFGPI